MVLLPKSLTDYWCSELESLGLKVRLNEFNDQKEVSNLCHAIKKRSYKKYKLSINER